MSLRLRLGVHERQVVGTRAFSSSSTVLELSALDLDTAIRDPHRIRCDALVSRWSLDVTIAPAAAYGMSRFMASVVFGITTTDVTVFVAVPLLLSLVALLAVWLPARRASCIDPMRVLRFE